MEIFFSQTVTLDFSQTGNSKNERIRAFWGLQKKGFSNAIEIVFLCMVDTFLKLYLQKMFPVMCRCETVTFDLSQSWHCKNKKIWVFWGLNKEDLSLCIENTFSLLTWNLYCEIYFYKIFVLNGGLSFLSNWLQYKVKNRNILGPKDRKL